MNMILMSYEQIKYNSFTQIYSFKYHTLVVGQGVHNQKGYRKVKRDRQRATAQSRKETLMIGVLINVLKSILIV